MTTQAKFFTHEPLLHLCFCFLMVQSMSVFSNILRVLLEAFILSQPAIFVSNRVKHVEKITVTTQTNTKVFLINQLSKVSDQSTQ